MIIMDPVGWHSRESTLFGIVSGSVGAGVWRTDESGGYRRWWVMVWGVVGVVGGDFTGGMTLWASFKALGSVSSTAKVKQKDK